MLRFGCVWGESTCSQHNGGLARLDWLPLGLRGGNTNTINVVGMEYKYIMEVRLRRGFHDGMGERKNGISGKPHNLGEGTALGGERADFPSLVREFGEGTLGQPICKASGTPYVRNGSVHLLDPMRKFDTLLCGSCEIPDIRRVERCTSTT